MQIPPWILLTSVYEIQHIQWLGLVNNNNNNNDNNNNDYNNGEPHRYVSDTIIYTPIHIHV